MILAKKLFNPNGYVKSLFVSVGIVLKGIFVNIFFKSKQGRDIYGQLNSDGSRDFKGKLLFKKNNDGNYLCNGCMLCVEHCPVKCIDILLKGRGVVVTSEKEIEDANIDIKQCILCGLCIEACPVEAIVHTNEHILVSKG